MTNKSKIFRFVFSVALSLLTLYILFKKIPTSEIINYFNFDIKIILFTLLLFFFIKFANTLRFAYMYKINPNKKLFFLLSYSNLMLNLFPFRLGELSYIYGLKRQFGKQYSEGTSKLVKIRFFDYISIYTLLMISSIYVNQKFSNIISLISLFFIIFLILFICGLFIIVKLNLSQKIKFEKIKNVALLIESEIKNGLKTDFKREFYTSIISLTYWILRLLNGYIILKMLGIQISFFTLSFITLVVFMLNLIPVQFFAGFGVLEGGLAYFLIQLGFKYSKVLPILLIYHIYLLLPAVVYGSIGYLVLRKQTS